MTESVVHRFQTVDIQKDQYRVSVLLPGLHQLPDILVKAPAVLKPGHGILPGKAFIDFGFCFKAQAVHQVDAQIGAQKQNEREKPQLEKDGIEGDFQQPVKQKREEPGGTHQKEGKENDDQLAVFAPAVLPMNLHNGHDDPRHQKHMGDGKHFNKLRGSDGPQQRLDKHIEHNGGTDQRNPCSFLYGPRVVDEAEKGKLQGHKGIEGQTFHGGGHLAEIPGQPGITEKPDAAQQKEHDNVQQSPVQYSVGGKIKGEHQTGRGAQHQHGQQHQREAVRTDVIQQNISAGPEIDGRHFQGRLAVLKICDGKDAVLPGSPQGRVAMDFGPHLVIAGKGAVIKAIDQLPIHPYLHPVQGASGGEGAKAGIPQVNRYGSVLPKGNFFSRLHRKLTAGVQPVPAGVQPGQRLAAKIVFVAGQAKNDKKAGESQCKDEQHP